MPEGEYLSPIDRKVGYVPSRENSHAEVFADHLRRRLREELDRILQNGKDDPDIAPFLEE